MPANCGSNFARYGSRDLHAIAVGGFWGIVFLSCSFIFHQILKSVWARDKYLDEWERGRKHEAMAFAMQSMTCIFAAVMCFGVFADLLGWTTAMSVSVSLYGVGVAAACLMMMGFMMVQIYLLATTKAIDAHEIEAL